MVSCKAQLRLQSCRLDGVTSSRVTVVCGKGHSVILSVCPLGTPLYCWVAWLPGASPTSLLILRHLGHMCWALRGRAHYTDRPTETRLEDIAFMGRWQDWSFGHSFPGEWRLKQGLEKMRNQGTRSSGLEGQ